MSNSVNGVTSNFDWEKKENVSNHLLDMVNFKRKYKEISSIERMKIHVYKDEEEEKQKHTKWKKKSVRWVDECVVLCFLILNKKKKKIWIGFCCVYIIIICNHTSEKRKPKSNAVKLNI